MKKISIYSFLVASVLFTTGCSEKNVDMTVDNTPKQVVDNSESALNTIPDTTINEITDGSFSMAGEADNGVYYIINGKKVLIENVYFGFNKYNLTTSMKDVVMNNANKLSAVNTSSTIKVTGNTDEWGTDEYNYALGLKRAKVVKDVLINNGVNANVRLVTLGESNPACTEKTSACWQKNRRVEHALTK
ncbi:OmpA family protein [Poseidonibacter ostreae]|uniref:OmpA family protein n=1 Tax=Poseidonibacter ostreae TaxID=2654171 RepID=A0A6L4WUU7_9BACT|nr:OmpA family protein [Poseidonibacter ostreae]KAB7890121.1 OmpA family protein [Poseidonibacter ostreae]